MTMNVVVTSTCVGQIIFIARRAGIWLSSRSAEKAADIPVTSLVSNHVHNIQNPTAESTSWPREDILNTIPTIDVTIYNVAPLADNRTFPTAIERMIMTK